MLQQLLAVTREFACALILAIQALGQGGELVRYPGILVMTGGLQQGLFGLLQMAVLAGGKVGGNLALGFHRDLQAQGGKVLALLAESLDEGRSPIEGDAQDGGQQQQ